MIYGYIRVSTEKQDFMSQKYSIEKYCEYREFKNIQFVTEKVSGKVPREKRDLGKLVQQLQKDDVLICSELSRLGRSITDTLITLDILEQKEVQVHLIKENQISGTKEFSMLCAVYAIIAQTERQRISERTKEALQAKIAQGMKIGHFKGYKCTNTKLTPYKNEILQMLLNGASILAISKKYGVKWITARDFIRDRLHYDMNAIESRKKYNEAIKKSIFVSNRRQN